MVRTSEAFPSAVASERALDRRRFLRAAASAAVLVAAGEWTARRADTAPRTPGRLTLSTTDPLAVGEARALTTPDGVAVLAVRLEADRVVAFERRCPHLGCPVVWAAARDRFECPCHRAAFDARSGEVLFGPPRRGLTPVVIA